MCRLTLGRSPREATRLVVPPSDQETVIDVIYRERRWRSGRWTGQISLVFVAPREVAILRLDPVEGVTS